MPGKAPGRHASKKAAKATSKAKRASRSLVKKEEAVEINMELVEKTVEWINKRAADVLNKAASTTIQIGDHILKNFFDGDPGKVQFRGRHKETSFTRLADHPDLQMSKTSLYNAVNLAIQERHLLNAGVQSMDKISPTHKLQLFQVKDMKTKKELIKEIQEKKYSVRQLQDRIRAKQGKMLLPANSDATATPGFRVPRPVLSVPKLDIEKLTSEKRLSKLDDTQLDAYVQALKRSIATLEKMAEHIRAYQRKIE